MHKNKNKKHEYLYMLFCAMLIGIFVVDKYIMTNVSFIRTFGFDSNLTAEGKELYRFITSGFIHSDAEHLISNVTILSLLFYILKDKFKAINILSVLLLGVIFGNIFSLFESMFFDTYKISVGISSGITALLAVSLVYTLENKGKNTMIALAGIIMLGADIVAKIYGLNSGFDAAAHLGGYVSGYVLAEIYYAVKKGEL